jgi:hypothetical protein
MALTPFASQEAGDSDGIVVGWGSGMVSVSVGGKHKGGTNKWVIARAARSKEQFSCSFVYSVRSLTPMLVAGSKMQQRGFLNFQRVWFLVSAEERTNKKLKKE